MEIKEYINILKKRFMLIFIVTILCTFVSAIFSYLIVDPKYKADISVIIGKKEDGQSTSYNYNDIMMYQKLVKTYSTIATSRTVIEDVKSKQNLDYTVEQIKSMISATPQGDSQLLTLTVESESPETSARIANQLAYSLKAISKDILNEDSVHILDEALIPTAPSSPRPMLNMLIAFFIGLMVSVGIVFLLEYLDNTVKTQEDVEKLIGIPVIGIIPMVEGENRGEHMLKNLVAFKNPKSRAAEAFRTLRTNIQFSGLDESLNSIVVTSSGPSEGKSTVLINLAITIAQSGKNVLVVDCDLRRPTVHKKLGLPNSEGLTNILIQEKKDYNDIVLTTKIPNLSAITSGPTPPNPAELLGTKRMKNLVNQLINSYDMVLIDAPPVIAVTDAQILATIADGTLIVTSYGATEKFGLVKTKELLDKVGAKILGVVINKVPEKSEHYYYGKYYNSYYKQEK